MNGIPKLDASGLRRFALMMALMMGFIFGILVPWLFAMSYPMWPWLVSVNMVIWALVHPRSVNILYLVWMRFGLLMNSITTPVLLALLFFLVMMPIAFIMKLVKAKTLTLKLNPELLSYRVKSDARLREDMEKPY